MRRLALVLALLLAPCVARAQGGVSLSGAGPSLSTLVRLVPAGANLLPGIAIGPYTLGNVVPYSTFGLFAAGYGALGLLTNGNAEDEAIGIFTLGGVTTGTFDTAMGESSCALDNFSYTTCFGGDTGRDIIGATPISANSIFGAASVEDGSGSQNSVFGALSMHGSAGSIEYSGTTATANDVYSITFTSANGNTVIPTGNCGAGCVSYTATGADTPSTISTAMNTLVNGLGITNTRTIPAGAFLPPTALSSSTFFDNTSPANYFISLHFPGTPTSGAQLAFTASCTGTCTGVTTTALGAFTGGDNTVFGYKNLYSWMLTTATQNSIFGDQIAGNATTTFTNNSIFGFQAMKNASSDTESAVFGSGAGQLMYGTKENTFFGFQAGNTVTTGGHNTIIGGHESSDGPDIITTASGDIEIGWGAKVNSATAGNQLAIGQIIFGNNLGHGSASSGGQIGINVQTGFVATLTVGDAAGTATYGSHLGFLQTTLPVITNGTVDAKATDDAGTVTETGTQTTSTVTFNKTFTNATHCTVTSPSGLAAITYTVSATALVVTHTSATAGTYTYQCF